MNSSNNNSQVERVRTRGSELRWQRLDELLPHLLDLDNQDFTDLDEYYVGLVRTGTGGLRLTRHSICHRGELDSDLPAERARAGAALVRLVRKDVSPSEEILGVASTASSVMLMLYPEQPELAELESAQEGRRCVIATIDGTVHAALYIPDCDAGLAPVPSGASVELAHQEAMRRLAKLARSLAVADTPNDAVPATEKCNGSPGSPTIRPAGSASSPLSDLARRRAALTPPPPQARELDPHLAPASWTCSPGGPFSGRPGSSAGRSGLAGPDSQERTP